MHSDDDTPEGADTNGEVIKRNRRWFQIIGDPKLWNQNDHLEKALSFLIPRNLNSTKMNTYAGLRRFHSAIVSRNINVVKKFIDNGVDVNSRDWNDWTPLHSAACLNEIECIYMLFKYGANPRIKTKNREETPLILAFKEKYDSVIKLLLPRYHEFTNVNVTNIIIEYDDDINNSEDILLLMLSMRNGYVKPFKLIWSRIDTARLVMDPDEWFFPKFLHQSGFAPPEWLDCLYHILDDANLRNYLMNDEYGLKDLFLVAKERNCKIKVLYFLLSKGMNIEFCHTNSKYGSREFKQELEAFIYAEAQVLELPTYEYLLLFFLYSFVLDHNTKNVFTCFCIYLNDTNDPNGLIPWFRYFSLPSDMKSQLLQYRVHDLEEQEEDIFAISLNAVPEVPSLLELGRLAVERSIKQSHNIKKPYQYRDAIKALPLPNHLKNIMLYKTPIY